MVTEEEKEGERRKKREFCKVIKGHKSYVSSVVFSPDGKQVISGSGGKTIRTWDAESGEEMHKLEGHEEGVKSVAFNPDGRQIVSGSFDKTIV